MQETIITVTKMDAVRRQLNTAIELWFSDGDPVAIHTLASASHDVLHILYRKKGLTGLIFDAPLIEPEHRKQWSLLITECYNFFKHGRQDTEKTINFSPRVNEFLIAFQVLALKKMGETLFFFEEVFMNWHFINSPKSIKEAYEKVGVPDAPILRSLTKQEFLHEFRRAWNSNISKQ
jgi:hypothetical protein